jgi:hypothetical protein
VLTTPATVQWSAPKIYVLISLGLLSLAVLFLEVTSKN